MLLDGVLNEFINIWLDKDIIILFLIRNDEINFKIKDIWDVLIYYNWYYLN